MFIGVIVLGVIFSPVIAIGWAGKKSYDWVKKKLSKKSVIASEATTPEKQDI